MGATYKPRLLATVLRSSQGRCGLRKMPKEKQPGQVTLTGKAAAANQGRRAARGLLTAGPGLSSLQSWKGKPIWQMKKLSCPGIRGPARQAGYAAALPRPPSRSRLSRGSVSPALSQARTQALAITLGEELKMGLGKHHRMGSLWPPLPLSWQSHPPCQVRARSSTILETTQALPALLPPATTDRLSEALPSRVSTPLLRVARRTVHSCRGVRTLHLHAHLWTQCRRPVPWCPST